MKKVNFKSKKVKKKLAIVIDFNELIANSVIIIPQKLNKRVYTKQ